MNPRLLKGTFLLCALAGAPGCFFRVNYLPSGVKQEIGANHLARASARWICEGDEQLALVGSGDDVQLFVASQDFLVPLAQVEPESYVFKYTRKDDGFNVAGAALNAAFVVPRDPKRDALSLYGTLFRTRYTVKSGTSGDIHWVRTSSTFEFEPYWSDRCWPASAPLSSEAAVRRVYHGVQPVSGPPPGARHMVVWMCGPNEQTSWGIDTNIAGDRMKRAEMGYGATGQIISGEDTSLFPVDFWFDANGGVTLTRADGSGFRLTQPASYSNTQGWLYERAGTRYYVNPKKGEEAIFLFPFDSGAVSGDRVAQPPADFKDTYRLACALQDPKELR